MPEKIDAARSDREQSNKYTMCTIRNSRTWFEYKFLALTAYLQN